MSIFCRLPTAPPKAPLYIYTWSLYVVYLFNNARVTYLTWKAGSALSCRIINKSWNNEGRHFQKYLLYNWLLIANINFFPTANYFFYFLSTIFIECYVFIQLWRKWSKLEWWAFSFHLCFVQCVRRSYFFLLWVWYSDCGVQCSWYLFCCGYGSY